MQGADNPGLMVDIVLAVIIIGALFGGWRQGAFASVLSTIGVIGGVIAGAALAPWVMSYTDSTAFRFLLAIATVLLLIGIGNMIGAMIGGAMRQNMRTISAQRVDSAIGAVFQAAATLIVAWLIAIPLVTAAPGGLAKGLKSSQILQNIDRIAPEPLRQLPTQISAMLNESGLPPLLSPFEEASRVEVAAPRIEVERPEVVEKLRPAVVHVTGQADKCRHLLSGTGFVFDEDFVLTNAHVVAGTETVKLDTMLGVQQAKVVYYNPDVDIAVIHAPDLGITPMGWAEQPAEPGSDAIVMGYPGSGPFTATPARVREIITINGPDIYAKNRLDREAYTIRGSVRQGNSGGPLTTTDGEVLGMIFGAAADNTDTGYALTKKQVLDTIGDYRQLVSPVNTQECVLK
ncbi:Serine protease [Corynebacterium kalinowskii]|uniref:Serine protease n=2 Tax=Corynebacterium kalinowskii TaxID=2675216 RepID=A0A6B8VVR5_9CORY|nr:Serine protease [Corynebacterium kalinowskii]